MYNITYKSVIEAILLLQKDNPIFPSLDSLREAKRVRNIPEKHLRDVIEADIRLMSVGYEYDGESSTLLYASGSCANFLKIWVYGPTMQDSVVKDTKVPTYSVKTENFSEAGYAETDIHVIKEYNVLVDNVDQVIKLVTRRS